MEECSRQAKEEAERSEVVFGQREKKLADDWMAQLGDKEVNRLPSTYCLRSTYLSRLGCCFGP